MSGDRLVWSKSCAHLASPDSDLSSCRSRREEEDQGGSVEDLLAEDDYGDLYEEEAEDEQGAHEEDQAATAGDGEERAAREASSRAGSSCRGTLVRLDAFACLPSCAWHNG